MNLRNSKLFLLGEELSVAEGKGNQERERIKCSRRGTVRDSAGKKQRR
jgi:hypothetical protein